METKQKSEFFQKVEGFVKGLELKDSQSLIIIAGEETGDGEYDEILSTEGRGKLLRNTLIDYLMSEDNERFVNQALKMIALCAHQANGNPDTTN